MSEERAREFSLTFSKEGPALRVFLRLSSRTSSDPARATAAPATTISCSERGFLAALAAGVASGFAATFAATFVAIACNVQPFLDSSIGNGDEMHFFGMIKI